MNRLRKPRAEEIESRLASAPERFTYEEVGSTRALDAESRALTGRYDVDRYEFDLGTGRERFERAREALVAWHHFQIPWVEFYGASSPAHAGQVVGTLVSVAGLWFFNPCRVVYTELSDASSDCAAFAYGTLPGHVESGEERFEVSHDSATGGVKYRILAFSRPGIWLTRLGYPATRLFQRRFARWSGDALRRASA